VKLIVDTHALLWALDDPAKLSQKAAVELKSLGNDLVVSAGTIWEIAIKVGLNKLSLSLPYRQWMAKAVTDLGLVVIPITLENAEVQAGLPHHHRDPFDRLLVAQCLVDSLPVVSMDAQLDSYGVIRIW